MEATNDDLFEAESERNEGKTTTRGASFGNKNTLNDTCCFYFGKN
jgi:hypothetical protein